MVASHYLFVYDLCFDARNHEHKTNAEHLVVSVQYTKRKAQCT